MRRQERLEFGHELTGRTGGEVSFDPKQQRLKQLLLESPAPLGDASLAGDVAERLAAVQREGLTEQRPRLTGIRSGLVHQCVEPLAVELEVPGAQRVPGGLA